MLLIRRIKPCGAVFTLVVMLSCIAGAQDSSYQGQNPDWGLRVEIKTDKRIYSVGEPIYFTVLLRNRGTHVVYISKSFGDRGDGTGPGFHIYVKQSSDKKYLGEECGRRIGTADRLGADARTRDQILREDYMVLAPGAIVGFETHHAYGPCDAGHPGEYLASATYVGQVLNVTKVEDGSLVAGSVLSESFNFRVRESPEKLPAN